VPIIPIGAQEKKEIRVHAFSVQATGVNGIVNAKFYDEPPK
jgi:hypothetical protein